MSRSARLTRCRFCAPVTPALLLLLLSLLLVISFLIQIFILLLLRLVNTSKSRSKMKMMMMNRMRSTSRIKSRSLPVPRADRRFPTADCRLPTLSSPAFAGILSRTSASRESRELMIHAGCPAPCAPSDSGAPCLTPTPTSARKFIPNPNLHWTHRLSSVLPSLKQFIQPAQKAV